jgi:hypothetical protein
MEAHVRHIEAIYDEELSRTGALTAMRNGADGSGGSPSPRRTSSRPRGRAALEVPPV